MFNSLHPYNPTFQCTIQWLFGTSTRNSATTRYGAFYLSRIAFHAQDKGLNHGNLQRGGERDGISKPPISSILKYHSISDAVGDSVARRTSMRCLLEISSIYIYRIMLQATATGDSIHSRNRQGCDEPLRIRFRLLMQAIQLHFGVNGCGPFSCAFCIPASIISMIRRRSA